MTWWAVEARPDAWQRDMVAAWLVAATGHAVEERADGTLVSFAKDELGAIGLCRGLATECQTSAEHLALEPVDWTTRWREGIVPRRIGRLYVTPSWFPVAPGERFPVVIDPETAFGSGEHGSTRAALALLDRFLAPGVTVLDLGSGSGILAIAAARLGANRVVGIESDVDANVIARQNVERNDATAAVAILDGEAGALAPLLGPVDVVVSNILRSVNTQLLPAIAAALLPGGVAIFSGMESGEAAAFLPALRAERFAPMGEVEDSGWWAVAARYS